MKVIMLDIDGVLNYENSKSKMTLNGIQYAGIDSNKIDNLATIVRATDAKIVLSSTWREHYVIEDGYAQKNTCGKYLANKMRKRGLHIYDKIGDNWPWNLRGHQIREWLDEHPAVTDYVILDDEIFADYYDFDLMSHVIKTINYTDNEKYAGLTLYLAQWAIEILEGAATGLIMDKGFIEEWTMGGERPIDRYDLFRI